MKHFNDLINIHWEDLGGYWYSEIKFRFNWRRNPRRELIHVFITDTSFFMDYFGKTDSEFESIYDHDGISFQKLTSGVRLHKKQNSLTHCAIVGVLLSGKGRGYETTRKKLCRIIFGKAVIRL